MNWFGLLWLGILGCFIAAQAVWLVSALRTGIVTYYFHYDFNRDTDPLKFWMLTAGRAVAVVFGVGLFVTGLQFWMT